MGHLHLTRGSRTVAGLGAGLVAAAGLTLVASPQAVAAPSQVTVASHTIDFSETRSTGHNDFVEGGIRVWTEGTTSTDKAAGYFDVDVPLSDAATTEPVLAWTKNAAQANNSRPGLQLKTDFNGDGSIDATLVGEASYADGTTLYGDDWWVPASTASADFVKEGAPQTDGGSGSAFHGTLDEWSEEFPDAQVIQSGWSLGSGVMGDGVISSIGVGEVTYTFAQSAAPTETTLYENDVDLSQTRAKGSNEFLEEGGVRVITLPSDGQDPKPGGGVWSANKAAGYFPVGVPLSEAGEPSMDYAPTSGARPSVQLVTDFDGDGAPDGILVGEAVYGRDWWVPNSAADFVKEDAPQTDGGSGSAFHGLLSEWRAAFPDAVVLQGGWSLGSGVEGNGVISTITVGLEEYTFSGLNRVPVVGDVTATAMPGRTVTATLPASDPDGDELTYASDAGAVDGNLLTLTVRPGVPAGTYQIPFTVSDGEAATDAFLELVVQKAPTRAVLAVSPQKITTATKKVRLEVTLTSTGLARGKVFFFDGERKLGAATLRADGTATYTITKPLTRGKHELVAKYFGNGSTLAAQKTVRKTVKRG